MEMINRFLYRIQNDETLAELMVISDKSSLWNPGTIILDNSYLQLGSFSPSGLWKFTALSSLINDNTLRQKHGLVPDRSSFTPLETPSAAILWPLNGGLLARRTEDDVQTALWEELFLTPYMPLTLGVSMNLPDAAEELEDSWFNDKKIQDGNPVYHSAIDP